MQNSRLIFFIFLFLTIGDVYASDGIFSDQMVSSPKLEKPKRGTLKGDFADLGENALNQKTGSFDVKLPIAFPTERGNMGQAYAVSYSPSFGLSAFGIGMNVSLSVERYRETGLINFLDDDLTGSFGVMTKGDDGFWYPKGMKSKNRAEILGDELIVYGPGQMGMVSYFGSNSNELYVDRTVAGDVHGWRLRKTIDKAGHQTVYNYKKFSEEGRVYLESIFYGGKDDDFQYKIEFHYSKTNLEFYKYTLGKKIVSDRKVEKIKVQVLESGSFAPRYEYRFVYGDPVSTPGFRLLSMQKFYGDSDTVSEPRVSFQYDSPSDYLENVSWAEDTELNEIADKYNGLITNYLYSTYTDVNEDGRPDIEVGQQYDQYRRTDNGFEKVELKQATGEISSWCMFPIVHSRKPRKFIKMFGVKKPSYVYDLFTYNSGVVLDVCLPNGERVDYAALPRFWDGGNNTIFFDLNNDQRPDLLHLRGDSYEVIYNESENEKLIFSELATPVRIDLPSIYHSFWVKDLNGDGHGDLVLKGDSTIYVHHGHADGGFEQKYQTFDFYLPSGSISSQNLRQKQILFLDLNKDSLPDILLQGDGFITMHVNTGSRFVQKRIPGLFIDPGLFGNMVVADLGGSGNTQICSSVRHGIANKMMVLNLDRPSLGLLKSLDDGKGNRVTFEYGKSGAEIGVSIRKTILNKTISNTIGIADVSREYDYSNISLNDLNNNFLGFANVAVATSGLGKSDFTYKYFGTGLDYMLLKEGFDFKRPDFVSFTESESVLDEFNGISYLRKDTVRKGFRDNNSAEDVSSISTMEYDESLCLSQEVKSFTSNSGNKTLETVFEYINLPAFSQHLSCLMSAKQISGSGSDSFDSFTYNLFIDRDQLGRPRELSMGTGPAISIQSIFYGENGLISEKYEPSTGSTFFSYDQHYRLNAVQNPDMTVTTAEEFNIVNDMPLELATFRNNSDYGQFFRYDSFGRLNKSWDDLGIFSEAYPETSYQYNFATNTKPGKIYQTNNIERLPEIVGSNFAVELTSGKGESLATLLETNSAIRVQKLTERIPAEGETYQYQDYLINSASNLESLLFTDLDFSKRKVLSSSKDFLEKTADELMAIQDGVNRQVSKDTTINENELVETTIENSDSTLQEVRRIDGNGKLVEYLDQKNNSHRYQRDPLGRIHQIIFPNGTTQTIEYDSALGKISSIERSGIGKFEYDYDPTTTLLAEKRILDRNGNLSIRENHFHDTSGRLIKKSLRQYNLKNGKLKSTLDYIFHYDGLNLPVSERKGQLGFQTGVTISKNKFEKRTRFRDDGKLLYEMIIIPDYRSLEKSYTYYSHGELKDKTITLHDLSTENGAELLSYSLNYEYNNLGKLSSIKKDGIPFSDFTYNSFGDLQLMNIANIKSIEHGYDELTRKSQDYHEKDSSNGNGSTTFMHQTWNYSNRGLIDSSQFMIDTRLIDKSFSYSSRGFLETSDRSDSGTGALSLLMEFQYGTFGEMTSSSKDGVASAHVMEENRWTIGDLVYELDTLGRVVSKDGKEFVYGVTGRIKEVRKNKKVLAGYFYDEENNPILKLKTKKGTRAGAENRAEKIREVYFDELTLINGDLFDRVQLGARMVGYFKNGEFVSASFDHLNTNIVDEDGVVRAASPYGERETRTSGRSNGSEVFKIADYTQKGYDSDIGAIRMGHRFYDVKAKRFLAPDLFMVENSEKIVESPVEGNLYSYAGNNPVSFVDPDGDGVFSTIGKAIKSFFVKIVSSPKAIDKTYGRVGLSTDTIDVAKGEKEPLHVALDFLMPGGVNNLGETRFEDKMVQLSKFNQALESVGTTAQDFNKIQSKFNYTTSHCVSESLDANLINEKEPQLKQGY